MVEFRNRSVNIFSVEETDDSNVLITAYTCNEIIAKLAYSI